MNNTINTCNFVPEKAIKPTKMCTDNFTKMDTSNVKQNVEISQKCEPTITFGNQPTNSACIITNVTVEHAKVDNKPVIDSDDDFMVINKANKHMHASNESDSEDELVKSEAVRSPLILSMLPDGYTYKMLTATHFNDLESFICDLKIKLDTEKSARKWIEEYNTRTKETMVYECCKSLSGKRVVKNFYLRCQDKQRQTGKHTKSNKTLKTTHKLHNSKNTDCPAQVVITLLPQKNMMDIV